MAASGNKIYHDNLEQLLKPNTRVFISFDLTNSTSIKQIYGFSDESRTSLGFAWSFLVQHFFEKAKKTFQDEYLNTLRNFTSRCDDIAQETMRELWIKGERTPPNYWKTQGDEILFHARVPSPAHYLVLISATIKTQKKLIAVIEDAVQETLTNEYFNHLKDEDKEIFDVCEKELMSLSCKPTLWTGIIGLDNIIVPQNRRESGIDWLNFIGKEMGLRTFLQDPNIKSPEDLANEAMGEAEKRKIFDSHRDLQEKLRTAIHDLRNYDFFGPTIDTGFRVSVYAGPEYLTLSIEAARLLADVLSSFLKDTKPFMINACYHLLLKSNSKDLFGTNFKIIYEHNGKFRDPKNNKLKGLLHKNGEEMNEVTQRPYPYAYIPLTINSDRPAQNDGFSPNGRPFPSDGPFPSGEPSPQLPPFSPAGGSGGGEALHDGYLAALGDIISHTNLLFKQFNNAGDAIEKPAYIPTPPPILVHDGTIIYKGENVNIPRAYNELFSVLRNTQENIEEEIKERKEKEKEKRNKEKIEKEKRDRELIEREIAAKLLRYVNQGEAGSIIYGEDGEIKDVVLSSGEKYIDIDDS